MKKLMALLMLFCVGVGLVKSIVGKLVSTVKVYGVEWSQLPPVSLHV